MTDTPKPGDMRRMDSPLERWETFDGVGWQETPAPYIRAREERAAAAAVEIVRGLPNPQLSKDVTIADTEVAVTLRAEHVGFEVGSLIVVLRDGRQIRVPISRFPRLAAARSGKQLNNWQLIGGGIGIHWPDLDEDISVENLLPDSELLTYKETPVAPEHIFDPGDHAVIEAGHLCHDCGKPLEEHATVPKWLALTAEAPTPPVDLNVLAELQPLVDELRKRSMEEHGRPMAAYAAAANVETGETYFFGTDAAGRDFALKMTPDELARILHQLQVVLDTVRPGAPSARQLLEAGLAEYAEELDPGQLSRAAHKALDALP